MNKLLLLISASIAMVSFSYAQCVINPSAQTTPGANPAKENLPCIEIGQPYDQTIQGKIQTSGDTTITIATFTVVANIEVDSVRIDSITGLPSNIAWTKNPNVLLGGGNGCVNFNGTTTSPAGKYDLTAWGTAYLRIKANPPVVGPIDTPYVYTGNLNRFSPFGDYYVVVINPSAPCVVPSAIKNLNEKLNDVLAVYPNPNNGSFSFAINSNDAVDGSILVIDMNGKAVYNQPVNTSGNYFNQLNLKELAKGLYAVQLRTSEGVATKHIVIE